MPRHGPSTQERLSSCLVRGPWGWAAILYRAGVVWGRQAPLLCVEEGEDMLARHEALLHITELQIVHRQHVLLLFLLLRGGGTRGQSGTDLPPSLRVFPVGEHLGL